MTTASNDERVDRLYELPLAEFTGARNALAKELRKEGDREGADAVKGLKKPSIEAWTVNQLVRHHRDEIAQLLDLGEEQADVLASGDRGRLRQAMSDLRATLTSLSNHAEALLTASERKPTPALLERVTRMLQNAAATDHGRAALRDARFAAEPEPEEVDEGEVAPATPAAEKPRKKAAAGTTRDPAAEAAERAAAARGRAEAEAERSKLEHALRQAEERARLLKEKAEDLEKRAAEARDAAVAAQEVADAARETVLAQRGR